MLADLAEILDKFRHFEAQGCHLLFNAERVFFPDIPEEAPQHWKRHQAALAGGKRYSFLNAGAWIGLRETVLEFFSKTNKFRAGELFNCEPYGNEFQNSEQCCLHPVFEQFSPRVQLDYNC